MPLHSNLTSSSATSPVCNLKYFGVVSFHSNNKKNAACAGSDVVTTVQGLSMASSFSKSTLFRYSRHLPAKSTAYFFKAYKYYVASWYGISMSRLSLVVAPIQAQSLDADLSVLLAALSLAYIAFDGSGSRQLAHASRNAKSGTATVVEWASWREPSKLQRSCKCRMKTFHEY